MVEVESGGWTATPDSITRLFLLHSENCPLALKPRVAASAISHSASWGEEGQGAILILRAAIECPHYFQNSRNLG